MKLDFDRAATTIMAVAALAMVGMVGFQRFDTSTSNEESTQLTQQPSPVSQWRDIANVGIRVGSATAPLQVIEFADFECPYCRTFHQALSAVTAVPRDSISLVFVHFPLAQHRFARPAARVAECAERQRRFGAMHDLLFVKQDSLGLKSWESFARDAGIEDIPSFLKCATDTTRVARIEDGIAKGVELAIPGTPTVIINGKRYPELRADSLSSLLARLMSGNSN